MHETTGKISDRSVQDFQAEACRDLDVSAMPNPIAAKKWIVESLVWERRKTISFAMILVAAILGYGVYHTGSIKNTFNYLSGQRIFLLSESEELGLVAPKSVLAIQVRVMNLSSEECTVLGFGTSCSCLRTRSEFPLILGSGQSKCLTLILTAPAEYGRDFSATATVLTNTVTDTKPTVTLVGKTIFR
jgi:hypothetical protein